MPVEGGRIDIGRPSLEQRRTAPPALGRGADPGRGHAVDARAGGADHKQGFGHSGFTRGEISGILLGELAIITLLAVPLGLWIGYKLAGGLVALLDLELFRFPLVIERSTYALAAAVVIAASVVSGLLVRRRLDELDLVAVLKSRE